MGRVVRALGDDSGFILRGGCAVAFLVFMFLMAVVGQVSWEGFGATLVVSLLLTVLSSLFSRPSRPTFVPVESSAPISIDSPTVFDDTFAAQVKCVGCGVGWDLDEEEASLSGFICPECGTLMDSGPFASVTMGVDNTVAAQVQCIGCGVGWDLDEDEASLSSFTCPECGRLMDSGRFVRSGTPEFGTA